ncbi:pantoate--beta-alanine ligase [Virgibacillus halodenitrificans]|uniref:pantoate--beta-alanine ligase n=1 Tax=Virgibacillus halodenitrificans TaxID=1482 RepID=UPI0002D37BFB|nr:pantoate--beta-alanine ligase [Virgibacillus halodenitrificans]WHX27333.1 pantoate--beta-alanine ligase [Virgibacillus halodenitrificans]
MEIIREVNEMRNIIKLLKQGQKKIGFVPTMGFFHDGHLLLMKKAKEENDTVVSSVFVNPLQFGPNEDFDRYPRNEEEDIRKAEYVGVDFLFIPPLDEMYPQKMQITMTINDRIDVLCGKARPGHFDGVITVVTKLFHITQPDQVYFGMKDAQQVAVIDALINNLNFPISLIGLPTVREEDGLAKSSRNVNLSKRERAQANWLYKALKHGHQLVVDGEFNPAIIIKEINNIISNNTDGKIDYIEVLSYPELKPVSDMNQQVIIALAVQFERARLIDNLLLNEDGDIIRFWKQEESQ